MKGLLITIAVLIAALVFMLGAIRMQDSRDLLPSGTKIGGIDVGKEIPLAAEAKVRKEARWQGLRLQVGSRTWAFPKPQARPMAEQAVQQAEDESKERPFSSKILGRGGKSYPLRWQYSRYAIREYVKTIAKKVNQPAKEAEPIYEGGGQIKITAGKNGKALPFKQTVRDLSRASRAGGGLVETQTVISRPEAEDALEAKAAYPELLIVDRAARKLYFYKNLSLKKTYTVAVGMPGSETPVGRFTISSKSVDPAWLPPDWAGELAGQLVPGGTPENPLVSRWMGIGDGVGFHGTRDLYSLGSAASRGCIRMDPEDIIPLYNKIPLQTPVIISP